MRVMPVQIFFDCTEREDGTLRSTDQGASLAVLVHDYDEQGDGSVALHTDGRRDLRTVLPTVPPLRALTHLAGRPCIIPVDGSGRRPSYLSTVPSHCDTTHH